MKSQYISNGTLVRPLESISTNFASTVYYDGRLVLDRLEDTTSATSWISTISDELGMWGPCPITPDGLEILRDLRFSILQLYSAKVNGQDDMVRDSLEKIASGFDTHQETPPIGKVIRLLGKSDKTNLDIITSAIAFSSVMTVTGEKGNRLRKCPAPKCVLFHTQNHPKQRWCSSTCGNRSRVSRHYQQHH